MNDSQIFRYLAKCFGELADMMDEEEKKVKPARKAKAAEKAVEAPAAEPITEEVLQPPAKAVEEVPVIKAEALRELLMGLQKAQVKEIFAKFGIARFSELKEESFMAVKEEAERCLTSTANQ